MAGLTRTFRVVAFALLFFTRIAAAATTRPVRIFVTFDGKPLPGFHLKFWDGEQTDFVRATTNSKGVAVFRLSEAAVSSVKKGLPPFSFTVDSEDFVIDEPTDYKSGLKLVARHSATWQMRKTPRICDELARVEDIPVGGLNIRSADDYNRWYSRLTPRDIATCKTLAALQTKIGSLAPWYFYAYKGEDHQCVDGHAHEIDWAFWYRGLLAKATGANPGECESDWERWWSSKGYGRVPDHPHSDGEVRK
jgi:hypothetical protein